MDSSDRPLNEDHLDYYLDEFTFRFNRRRSRSRGKLFFRLVQQAVAIDPAPYELPGQSFLSALRNETVEGRDAVVVFDEYGYCRMIRTKEWKYVHRYPDGPHELYDLVNDADERQNLVDDPAHVDRKMDLREQMETWLDEYVIPGKDGKPLFVGGGQSRPVGVGQGESADAFSYKSRRR